MKVYISKDELYPMYYVDKQKPVDFDRVVEMTEKEYEICQSAMRVFNKAQRMISEIIEREEE